MNVAHDVDPPQPILVAKFGGTSVSTVARWRTIAAVIQGHLDERKHPVIVCSATAGTSDTLAALLDQVDDAAATEAHLDTLETRHEALAADLGVSPAPALKIFADVRERVTAARALGELTPRTRAFVLCSGEYASTLLGAAFLQSVGIDIHWRDARSLLSTAPLPEHHPGRWLDATCAVVLNPSLAADIRAQGQATLTQGFVAADALTGDPALLGRGGSDTSAAYLSAVLGAERLEIWTDVDGVYSAHPGTVSTARCVAQLSYAEAANAASLGARVLHPRCLAPVQEAGIPLHVRSTREPDAPGTRVSAATATPGVRAVVHRHGLHLIRMRRPPRWQQVGFLADVAGIFREHDVSIDLITTSPGLNQATIDTSSAPLLDTRLHALMSDLSEVCEPELLRDVASVSLVGTRLTRALSDVGSALVDLDDASIGLVAHGADDAHVTFVVRPEDADRVVRSLHASLLDTVDDVQPKVLAPPTRQAAP